MAAILATALMIGACALGVYLYSRSLHCLRMGLLSGITFGLSCYLTLVVFSFAFLPETIWNPRYPLGVFYSDIADRMTGAWIKLAFQYPRLLIRYQIGNTLTVLTVTGPFLFVLLLKAVATLRSPSSAADSDKRASYLFIWLLVGIPLATGLTSFFAFGAAIMFRERWSCGSTRDTTPSCT